jgi:hypothetical protein
VFRGIYHLFVSLYGRGTVVEQLAHIKFNGSNPTTSGTEKKKMAGIFLRL